MLVNRIIVNKPKTIFEAFEIALEELQYSSLVRTALLRYTVPEWGGPVAKSGEQISPVAIEVLKTIPIENLTNALALQELYFDKIQASKSCRRRNRCYLKKFIDWTIDNGWVKVASATSREPQFNRFNRPRGQRRVNSSEVRSTNLGLTPAFSLGTFDTDFIESNGQYILANPKLVEELEKFRTFTSRFRKRESNVEEQVRFLCQVFGYLHRIENVPLSELCIDLIVPKVQLLFSEDDFTGEEAFETNARGQLVDPIRAEQTIAMAEAMAQRLAKKKADMTINLLERYFSWRQQELANLGQPEGLAPTTKRGVLVMAILVSRFQYQDQTDLQSYSNFDDIPVIQRLRRQITKYKPDFQNIKKTIQKRCVSWPVAMKVFEQQRLLSLEYQIASRAPELKSKKSIRNRPPSSIATDIQKTVILGLMTLIPTDRQQTYRALKFGSTLKNGYFIDGACEKFIEQPVPSDPNDAQLWINLEDFKTVETYGEFWYPVPNVEFRDRTTFYEFIVGWLVGFEDKRGNWPAYHLEENLQWQGYINAEGQRLGWRAALKPSHDFIFTMPTKNHPYYSTAFTALIRGIFVRFTQEEGPIVAVTPHSFRHMLSSYLSNIDISSAEKLSFSYVLHHSVEMHQGSYVYQDNMSRITPAVKRMEQIIRDLIV